jgi:hypothetical protein
MFNMFFWNLCHLWDNVEKYGGARHATDNNTVHVFCMLDS